MMGLMPLRPSSDSALFIVRVWLEDECLRARIIESHDLIDGGETVAIVDCTAEIERRLREWLVAVGGNGLVTAR
jgi:hypothetical protein